MQRFEADLAQDRIHHNQQTGRFAGSALFVALDQVHTTGTDTPTNFPFCSAGPVLGTKFPNTMPMVMTSKIYIAKYWSRKPRF